MKELRVCFVGIGSIAKRHISNLTEICSEKGINLTIDCLRHGSGASAPEIAEKTAAIFHSCSELSASYDAIFITNPTSLHLDAYFALQDRSDCFFIEKPLCDLSQCDAFTARDVNASEKRVYVACPLRYTNVIQYIKENIDFSAVNSIRCISSSYLPEWRKGIDYRDTYSARKELGGGVSIDLIHEWDYIYYLIGKPKRVYSLIKKVSSLEINSDDIAIYIADYGDKTVELHLDYFGRKTIRKIELFTNEDTIVGDIANSRIIFEKSGRIIDLSEQRNDFQRRELEHFLDMISGRAVSTNDLRKSIDILKLTGGEC